MHTACTLHAHCTHTACTPQVKINSAACSSQYVCLGGADASIQCFNLEGQHTHDLAGHNKAVRVLAACERGRGDPNPIPKP